MKDGIATGYDSLREPSVKEANWAFCHSFRMILSLGRGLTFSRAKAFMSLG